LKEVGKFAVRCTDKVKRPVCCKLGFELTGAGLLNLSRGGPQLQHFKLTSMQKLSAVYGMAHVYDSFPHKQA
jgi:hypothetical protein